MLLSSDQVLLGQDASQLGDNVEGIAKELGGYGADKVLVCDSPLLKNYTTDAYA